ncbi:MAG: hypothetical protein Q8S75_15735 [Nitrospirota bacterium]|nr:hypothetical protein [Nitrospirota bacterium]
MPTIKARTANGQFVRQYYCDACQIISINGSVCHETGCPDAWMDALRDCRSCGADFKPSERYQAFCDQDCTHSYYD